MKAAPDKPDTNHRRRVDALLAQALEFDSPGERVAFVKARCADDAALRDEVLALLATDKASEVAMEKAFSERDAAVAGVASEDGARAGALVGSHIGNYRVEELVATGGMGAVYRAERSDGQFRQTVAIKILPHWAADRSTVARLRAERQILSSLQHPNITQLLTGGETPDGYPYLVTEFIDGLPVTGYAEANQLSVDQKLQLFCRIADAVHHAHTKLIVHRDIKPSNILVDQEGRPHLLDFGIAKILDPASTEMTVLHTVAGFTPMTLHYASPEQQKNSEITTASDIYQLGLLLYELLVGELPKADKTRNQVLPPPSSVPGVIASELRGDLDTIVLKALREDPAERYASAAEFASDVRRFSNGQAIVARRESGFDVARRLARHNPFGAFAVVAITALVLVWAVSVQVYSNRLEAERDYAAQQAARAARVKEVLTDIYRRHDPLEVDAIGDKTASLWDSLDGAVEKVSTELVEEPDIRAELYTIFASLYMGAGRIDDAIRVTREAERAYAAMGPEWLAELAVTRADLAGLLMNTARPEARALLDDAVSLVSTIEDSHPSAAVSVLQQGALIMHESANRREAIRFYEQAWQVYERHELNDVSRYIAILFGLGSALVDEDRLADAEPLLLEALSLGESHFGDGHARLTGVLDALSSLERNRGNLDAAVDYSNRVVEIMRRGRADSYENLLTARNNLALALAKSGRLTSAVDILEEVVEVRRSSSPDSGSAFLATSLKNLATIQHMAGDYVGAMQSAGEAQALMEVHLPPDSAYQATPHFTKALVYLDTGQAEEAELAARRSLELLAPVLGESHYQIFVNRCVIGEALLAQGRVNEARELIVPAMKELLAAETRVPRYETRCGAAQAKL